MRKRTPSFADDLVQRAAATQDQRPAVADGTYGQSEWYCEGRHRPAFRGKIHARAAIASPIWIAYQLSLCPDARAIGSVSISLLSTFLMLGASGAFHTLPWTLSEESMMAKCAR